MNSFDAGPLLRLPKHSLEAATIEKEALAYGLKVTRVSPRTFTVQDRDGHLSGFRRTWSTSSSVVGDAICRDKAACRVVVKRAGLPVATGATGRAGDPSAAYEFVERYGWPVVVKPINLGGGMGVTANISSRAELQQALKAVPTRKDYIIERHVSGDDYRFLVLGEEVIGVWARDAANVQGDGHSSISTLISKKNELRRRNPHLAPRPIKIDEMLRNHLARSARALSTIPEVDERVYLRSAANLSAGGDNIELLNETDLSLKKLAVDAVRAVPGIELAGVDLLLEDHSAAAQGQSVVVCEINSQPGISAHEYPAYGEPQPVSRKYLEFAAERDSVLLGAYCSDGSYRFNLGGSFGKDETEAEVASLLERLDVEASNFSTSGDSTAFTIQSTAVVAASVSSLCFQTRSARGRLESVEVARLL